MNIPTRINLNSASVWAALGVFSAGIILTEINILSARTYFRFDVSSGQRYTISQSSRAILKELDQPTQIYVLLSSADPILPEVRQLLQSYLGESPFLKVHYIDPDRQPAEFLALGKKFELGADALDSTNGLEDTGLLIECADKKWFVRQTQLSQIDDEGQHHFRIEGALTEGIAQVQHSTELRLCFTSGHGERSLDDAAPEGLIELRRRLSKSNLVPERVPLDIVDPGEALQGCDAIAVVGPSRPWPPVHERALLNAWENGTSLALFLDPIVDEHGKIIPWGLSSLTHALGASPEASFILETDPQMRLPSGLGESFFATPKAHSITQGLSNDQLRLDARVLMTAAAKVGPDASGGAVTLLSTSASAFTVDDLSRADSPPASRKKEESIPLPLAVANEMPGGPNKKKRAVVVGSSNLAENRSFRDPSLFGNRVFVENVFSWLLSRPTLVSVPERPPVPAGLNLSEDSLSSLLRYVLFYMPLAAASLGAYLLTRRRKREEDSRQKEAFDP